MARTLQDLTIKDSFLFNKVMSYGDNCKRLLEMILEVEIDHVEMVTEKTIDYNPDFICDFDPFGLGLFKYSINGAILEKPEYNYSDGSQTIILNTRGCNSSEVSKSLVDFLDYIRTNSVNSDEYVSLLSDTVDNIKLDRKVEKEFMNTEVIMYDKFLEGKAEGKAEGMNVMIKLVSILTEQKDYEALDRITKDRQYQAELLKRYNLV